MKEEHIIASVRLKKRYTDELQKKGYNRSKYLNMLLERDLFNVNHLAEEIKHKEKELDDIKSKYKSMVLDNDANNYIDLSYEDIDDFWDKVFVEMENALPKEREFIMAKSFIVAQKISDEFKGTNIEHFKKVYERVAKKKRKEEVENVSS